MVVIRYVDGTALLRIILALALGAVLLGYFTVLRRRRGWAVGDLFSRLDIFDGFLLGWAFSFLLLTIQFGFISGLMSSGLSYFTLFWSGVTLFLFRRNVKMSEEAALWLTFSVFFAVLFAFDEVWVILGDVLNGRPLALQHLIADHLRNIGVIMVSSVVSIKLGSGKWRIRVPSLLLAIVFSGLMFTLWILGGFPDFRYSREDDIVPLAYWFASMRLGANLVLRAIRIGGNVNESLGE